MNNKSQFQETEWTPSKNNSNIYSMFVVLVPTTAAWSDLLPECAAGMQYHPQPHQLGRDGAQRPDQVHGLGDNIAGW